MDEQSGERAMEGVEQASPGSERQALATFSPLLAGQAYTASLFGVRQIILKPSFLHADRIDFVVGWGQKETAAPAQEYAQRFGLPYLRAEDGFLRSVGLGVLGAPACSVVLDDLGIYYDARRPSRIEAWLNSRSFHVGDAERRRSATCIDLIRQHRLSKYNHTTATLRLGPKTRPRVLVVDQTVGDLSVALGGVRRDGFRRMLEAARAEQPGAEILIKTHPDVLAGKKVGFLSDIREDRDTRILGEAVNPIELLEQVDHVYVATSQLGFEALMMEKPVTCFGVPFYAGWGLTDDRVAIARRTEKRDLQQVFAAAYLRYARYVNPATGRRGSLEDLIEYIAMPPTTHGPARLLGQMSDSG